jgi:ABC-type amino acid transport system permease subunit
MVFVVDKVQSSTLEFARINHVVVIILIRILTTTIALILRGIPILLALFLCLYGLLGFVLSRFEQGKGSTVAQSSQEVM